METFVSELTRFVNNFELTDKFRNQLIGTITGLHHKYLMISPDLGSSDVEGARTFILREGLASELNGCQRRSEVSKAQEKYAKENGLVIVYGASDDLIEFCGAIYEEMGAGEITDHLFTKEGIFPDDDQIEVLDELKITLPLNKIESIWSPSEPECSWAYRTDIPHSTFKVMEGDELYCMGIIFHINDLK